MKNYIGMNELSKKQKATGHLNAKKMPMKAHENILTHPQEFPRF